MCGVKGDAIDYIQMKEDLGFLEAAQRLNLHLEPRAFPSARNPMQPSQRMVSLERKTLAQSDQQWQVSAAQFCTIATDALWSDAGKAARQYLYQRGLTDDVIRAAQLGYNGSSHRRHWGDTDVWLYAGIVIPWLIEDRYWKVNIRRKPSDVKADEIKVEARKKAEIKRYLQAKGGANGLYGETVRYCV